MKRKIFFLSFLFLCQFVIAQKTGQQLHMKDVECQYDTLAKIHLNATSVVPNEETKSIMIQEDGKNKILKIEVVSTKCDCTDCFESNELAIKIDSLKMNEAYYFKASEVIWVYKNTWIEPKYITKYLGNITQTGEKTFVIKISELLGATVIRSIHLNIRAEI